MHYSQYRFTLDLQKHQSQQSIAVFQYDTAVRLHISITDGGRPYLIDEGAFAIFFGKRADDEPLLHSCTIADGRTEIIYEFQGTTACVAGTVNCQLRLYGADQRLITAPRFSIVVDERVVDDDNEVNISGTTLSAIDDIILNENERIEAEIDRSNAEALRVDREHTRIQNEDLRQQQEQERQDAETLRVGADEARRQMVFDAVSEVSQRCDDAIAEVNSTCGSTLGAVNTKCDETLSAVNRKCDTALSTTSSLCANVKEDIDEALSKLWNYKKVEPTHNSETGKLQAAIEIGKKYLIVPSNPGSAWEFSIFVKCYRHNWHFDADKTLIVPLSHYNLSDGSSLYDATGKFDKHTESAELRMLEYFADENPFLHLEINGERGAAKGKVEHYPDLEPQIIYEALGFTIDYDNTTALDVYEYKGVAEIEGVVAHIVQSIGDSETEVMSQKAVTDEIMPFKYSFAEMGATYVLASGTAEANTTAFAVTRVVSGISLKKGANYRLNVIVDTEATTKYTVWMLLNANDDTTIRELTISTATLNNGSLEFTVDEDYEDAYIAFQTGATSDHYITANLEVVGNSTTGNYCPNTNFIVDDFVHGDPRFWVDGIPDLSIKCRVMCKLAKVYKYAQDIHIKVAKGFKVGIGYYTEGVITEDLGWKTEHTIPANQQFRIMIARVNDDTNETADIAEFVSKVSIFTNVLKEIYELASNNTQGQSIPNTNFMVDDFVHGDTRFWVGGIPDTSIKCRVMCKPTKVYKYAQDIHIKAAEGFKFAIGYYTDGVFTSDLEWQTEHTIPANQQFRIMIVRINEDTNETADIAEFVSKVSIFTNVLKEIYELASNNTQGQSIPNTNFMVDDFVHGDTMFWSGGNPDTSIKCRVMCKLAKVYKYAQDIHIKAAEGFKFAIGYYTDGVFTSDLGWQTEQTIPANQQFRIMIVRINEDTNETADIAEFVSKVSIFTNVLKEIYDLASNNTAPQYISVKPFEVLSINHRGYNSAAPENTLVAYKLSKKNGFDIVECDVRFTKDGVPVLLHDESINRTARNADGSELSNTINIADITYTEALNYDFGISKGAEYAGTKIPTLTEFMRLCRALSLHPYLDVYDATSIEKAQAICDIIASCGMERNITFLSSYYRGLSYIADILPDVRYGLVNWDENATTGSTLSNYIDVLKEKGVKNIFVDAYYDMNHSLLIAMCKEKGATLEVFCPNTEEEIIELDPFITGVTSDSLVAKDVLYNNYID